MREQTTRKPILLLRLSRVLLLRLAERTLLDVLFQEPPRKTRLAPIGVPDGINTAIGLCRKNRAHRKR